MVVLKIEIENKSKVRLTKSKIRFKVIRHDRSSIIELTEWVNINKDEAEICKTTKLFYPGSILKIDRLYRINDSEVLQGIIQFEAKFSWLQKKLADIRGRSETWTNTFIIAR